MKKTDKITAMIGKTWQHKHTEEVYKFFQFEENGQNLKIITDKKPLTTTVFDIGIFVSEFKEIIPASHEIVTQTKKQNEPTANTMDKSIMLKVRDALIESIDKVKGDKEYIHQAKQISTTAQTLINLAKLEVDIRTKL